MTPVELPSQLRAAVKTRRLDDDLAATLRGVGGDLLVDLVRQAVTPRLSRAELYTNALAFCRTLESRGHCPAVARTMTADKFANELPRSRLLAELRKPSGRTLTNFRHFAEKVSTE